MRTLSDNIASWEAEYFRPEFTFVEQDAIATESQQEERPEWELCIDALLQTWSALASLDVPQPSRSAIEAAIAWVAFLRKRFPSEPPTCIIPEPDGGIIVERRVRLANGRECVCELTFYNNGLAERTDYYDGRIVRMGLIPWQPNE